MNEQDRKAKQRALQDLLSQSNQWQSESLKNKLSGMSGAAISPQEMQKMQQMSQQQMASSGQVSPEEAQKRIDALLKDSVPSQPVEQAGPMPVSPEMPVPGQETSQNDMLKQKNKQLLIEELMRQSRK